MHPAPHRFIGRIGQVGGFTIYIGPCKSCPSAVEPWIKQFCSQRANSWYVPVESEWAGDWFNNYGFKELFPNYEFALDMISDKHSDEWTSLPDHSVASILVEAKQLYGLLHQRWICQSKGLVQMKRKFETGLFGTCPRFSCNDQRLLPVGATLRPQRHSVRVFCPQCYDVYRAAGPSKIDGAHFGPAFPHLFLYEYPEFDAKDKFKPIVLRAHGFVVHKWQRLFYAHETNKHREDVCRGEPNPATPS
jgi:casein kinase II subunit beta